MASRARIAAVLVVALALVVPAGIAALPAHPLLVTGPFGTASCHAPGFPAAGTCPKTTAAAWCARR